MKVKLKIYSINNLKGGRKVRIFNERNRRGPFYMAISFREKPLIHGLEAILGRNLTLKSLYSLEQ